MNPEETYGKMMDALEEGAEIEPQKFQVKDLLSADWALGKIRQMEMRMNERREVAARQITLIEAWVERENASDKKRPRESGAKMALPPEVEKAYRRGHDIQRPGRGTQDRWIGIPEGHYA